jgi:hypothetical protein
MRQRNATGPFWEVLSWLVAGSGRRRHSEIGQLNIRQGRDDVIAWDIEVAVGHRRRPLVVFLLLLMTGNAVQQPPGGHELGERVVRY